ncbi:MAG: ribbon-helix-helix domain-containing protein [bacterium]|nr:ribbon-helix-helix domain-containing protein [bacterium]
MNTQTLNISLPREMVKKIDELAKKEYRNRSELIRQALRSYLRKQMEWEEIFKAGKKIGKEMGITSEEQVNDIVYEFRHGRKPRKSSS